jgi:hypothetical protein
VTRAITLNPISYRKFYSVSWAKHSPHPCTCSRMEWWNLTSRRWKNTCGRSSHCIKGTGMRDYPSFS